MEMEDEKEVLDDIELGKNTRDALEETLSMLAHLEKDNKLRFVESLGKVFSSYKLWDIASMEYHNYEDDGYEVVNIRFFDGEPLSVNVTAGSLEAIVKDIIRNIECWR